MASERILKCVLFLLMTLCGCYGKEISCYYITPDPETSCGEDHEPCLTLDQFASEDINRSAELFLIPGNHSLSRNIEIVDVKQFSILADTSVNIQCTSHASFLFQDISNLEIRNTAIVSCGGGGSSGAVQVRSVQQFDFSNVTLQESASVSLSVQDSNGLVTGARFIGNTGAGMKTTNSTIVFEGSNTFSDNLDGGIASYDSTLQFIGLNQFTNNTATSGGGISAISSTINCSRNMTFEYNSAKQYGGGVYASSHATVTISGTSNFIGNSAYDGGGVCAHNYAAVAISGISNFTGNSAEIFGGGVYAFRHSREAINGTSDFMGNSAETNGGGIYATSNATVHINGNSNFIDNEAAYGGGMHASDRAEVEIRGTSLFTDNSALVYGGGVVAESGATLRICGTSVFLRNTAQASCGGVYASDNAAVYIIGDCSFEKNTARESGGGLCAVYNSRVIVDGNISFIGNSAKFGGGGVYLLNAIVKFSVGSLFSENWSQYGGGVSIWQSEIMFQGNFAFSNNNASTGGAIQAFDGRINITGNGNFSSNLATVNGGALALAGGSVVYIFETASFTFVENVASSFGGAIYEDSAVRCSHDWKINGILGIYDLSPHNCYYDSDSDLPSCFREIASLYNISISFSGNSAVAGSVLFGQEINKTLSNVGFKNSIVTYIATVADVLFYLFKVSIDDTNNGSIVSSNPNRICMCINGQPDCSDPPSPYEVCMYPGQTVGVSLVAVGQRNGTVPATITAQYDPDDGATFGDLQSTQKSSTTCSELRYTILSRRKTEEVKLNIDGSCAVGGIPLSVSITLQECPIGFSLSNSSDQCVCEERLQKYTSNCNISNLDITRTASEDFWVGVDNTNGTEGLILHPNCPFDYCQTDTVLLTLGNTSKNTDKSVCDTEKVVTGSNGSDTYDTKGIDSQCIYNRSGLLCGKCQKGFSVVFGSSKCLKCSNSYLSLLIAFALAGIVLVVFLLMLKLTVAVGTINGLIFYANIVSVNRAELFTSGETNILTVFIAWVNLDLGIETCFFDGMDAYSKAWLQYAFPVYVWALVGAIILASRHSTRIARCLGNNPVAVLATLFLLSYAKLLRSIINPLFVTFLEYPTDSKAVWLVDGNVPYLKGKHIPLFLISLLALFLLFVPFTLLLLLGQWIQAQSERKCCSWISDYRISAFLDVYHGPFKSKHRYWYGLLLVTRFCLFLVFAFNVYGDPSVNILAIAVCLIGLLVIILQFNVYKAWYLNVLEASFIINLLLLANGTYYVEISGGNQNALTYTSVSVAFATFCGIVFYHSCLQIKDSNLFDKFIFALNTKSSADDSETNCPDI